VRPTSNNILTSTNGMDVRECAFYCLSDVDCLSFSYSESAMTCILAYVKSNILAMTADSQFNVYDRIF
jgi:hypothetical protein